MAETWKEYKTIQTTSITVVSVAFTTQPIHQLHFVTATGKCFNWVACNNHTLKANCQWWKFVNSRPDLTSPASPRIVIVFVPVRQSVGNSDAARIRRKGNGFSIPFPSHPPIFGANHTARMLSTSPKCTLFVLPLKWSAAARRGVTRINT